MYDHEKIGRTEEGGKKKNNSKVLILEYYYSSMVQKISISLRNHSWERIAKSKPKSMTFSEWIEELAIRQLEAQQGLFERPRDAIIQTAGHQEERAQPDSNQDNLPANSCLILALNEFGTFIPILELEVPQELEVPRKEE